MSRRHIIHMYYVLLTPLSLSTTSCYHTCTAVQMSVWLWTSHLTVWRRRPSPAIPSIAECRLRKVPTQMTTRTGKRWVSWVLCQRQIAAPVLVGWTMGQVTFFRQWFICNCSLKRTVIVLHLQLSSWICSYGPTHLQPTLTFIVLHLQFRYRFLFRLQYRQYL